MTRIYWSMLAGFRGQALAGIILQGLGGAMEAFSLLLLMPVLGSLIGGNAAARVDVLLMQIIGPRNFGLLPVLLLLAAAGAASALLKLAGEVVILRVRNSIEVRAGTVMASALLEVAWEPFASLRQGDVAKSLLVEGNQMAYGVRQFLTGIGAMLTALPLVLAAFVMSAEMTAYTLGFGAAAALLFRLASRPVQRHVARLSDSIAVISVRIADVFGNLKFFRSTGLTGQARIDAEDAYRGYASAYFDSQVYPAALRHGVEAAAISFISGFLYWQLVLEQRPAAAVLVFLAIFYRLVPKIMAAQDFLFQARTYLPWFASWQERLAFCDTHRQASSGTQTPVFGDGLAFHNTAFRFSSGIDVLHEINLQLPPGRCIAVVGASGSGKTTLLDLATGLLRPTAGYLTLGGRPLVDIDLARWQERIGLVSQDCPVFYCSVLENIAWGNAVPDRALAEKCARQANAWEFIERLPQGIDTPIGERGANLSGGQRQRLGIARALYRQPWLLVLDEATSALDAVTEEAIQAALAEIKGQFAILLVAHRLKTVAMADEIVLIESGRIAERGSWAELVAKRGKFFDLLSRQGMGDD
ncbi:MAG TPA: ABC transporter ATP-binding protein/permease [Rhodocyclaceae bacterium]|nr:ABC transporter ATP-binding protein/permease [Rhodocyclaceae bacterium]